LTVTSSLATVRKDVAVKKQPHDAGRQEYSKLYYAISDVAEITGVKAHVLRYWESEFPSLKPRKTRTGSRRYRPADIDHVLEIKSLLYDQGFKIAGARKHLRAQKKASQGSKTTAPPQLALPFADLSGEEKLAFVKAELAELHGMVEVMRTSLDESERTTPLKEKKGRG